MVARKCLKVTFIRSMPVLHYPALSFSVNPKYLKHTRLKLIILNQTCLITKGSTGLEYNFLSDPTTLLDYNEDSLNFVLNLDNGIA